MTFLSQQDAEWAKQLRATKTLPELRARRAELLRQSWTMVTCPPPSGEQAGYAFDAAHDEIEREIADVERQIKALGVSHTPTPEPPQ